MSKHESLLARVEASPAGLTAVAPTIYETLEGFSAREIERLCDAITGHVRTALVAAGPALESEPDSSEIVIMRKGESVEEALATLTAAAIVARAIVVDPSFAVPESLQVRRPTPCLGTRTRPNTPQPTTHSPHPPPPLPRCADRGGGAARHHL